MLYLHVRSFLFNDTATAEIYTLSLHDALPICSRLRIRVDHLALGLLRVLLLHPRDVERSEEHTSELQSRQYLVCRLLLEKKKRKRSRSLAHHASSILAVTPDAPESPSHTT